MFIRSNGKKAVRVRFYLFPSQNKSFQALVLRLPEKRPESKFKCWALTQRQNPPHPLGLSLQVERGRCFAAEVSSYSIFTINSTVQPYYITEPDIIFISVHLSDVRGYYHGHL